MSCANTPSFTAREAAEHAARFCELEPTWQRYCDITEEISVPFKSLPRSEQLPWLKRYQFDDRSAGLMWDEFACRKPNWYPIAFISGEGRFSLRITEIPMGHNLMMIVQTGAPRRMWLPGQIWKWPATTFVGSRDSHPHASGEVCQ